MQLAIATKMCKLCGLQKPATEFNKNKNNKDGLYTYCKACTSVKAKFYRNKLKSSGLCVSCGKRAPRVGNVSCPECLTKHILVDKKSRERKAEAGKCSCGRHVAAGHTLCENCLNNSSISTKK